MTNRNSFTVILHSRRAFSVPWQHYSFSGSCLNHTVQNVSVYFGRRRPVLRSSTAEGGDNGASDILPVRGGTGYQPMAVGNLPTALFFRSSPLFGHLYDFCKTNPKPP
jgi:hypothetical protein